MKKSKHLILLTASYPYSGQEQFLIGEYFNIAKQYDQVHVFPLTIGTELNKNLPPNIIIHKELSKEHHGNILDYFTNIRTLLKIVYSELIVNRKRLTFIINFRYHLSEIIATVRAEKIFHKKIKSLEFSGSKTYHSAWMNKHTLMLAISKSKKHINQFTFRVHGYDIFNERHKNNYIPFENFNYGQSRAIILNSNFSFNYKKTQNIYPNKLKLNYFGLKEGKPYPFIDQATFVIVSCSGLIDLKRVELIAQSLKHIKFKLKWVHFGDGPNLINLSETCSKLPQNISVELKGNTPNKEILEYYEKNMINLFLHVSETEGLGFAIIEAQSFGIPAMACGAGGVNDVVTNDSGVKLPITISPKELAFQIINFRTSNKNTAEYRLSVLTHFNAKFEMRKNMQRFAEAIES